MPALNTFFTARSIAVVGASNHPEKVGHQVLRNLLGSHRLYPINPIAKSILSLPVFATLTEISDPIDQVIIATPASTVPTLIDEIIERNRSFTKKNRVTSVVIISAGFAEINQKGSELQHLIATKLAVAGIELLGPNSLGFIAPKFELNASFAQHNILAGNLGIISQSGAILTAIFDALQDRQCGVSFAISLGNKAGVSENDCLEYALKDPSTDVVLLYLESFTDLPNFFARISELRRKKPVILLKGGMSQRGQQASLSHTAALATNQVLLQAAADQVGLVIVENIQEFLDLAFFLSHHHHIPENVMVLTNAGGPAVNTIDELEKKHVPLAQWSKKSQQDFDDHLPQLPVHNPMDLLGDATPERIALAVQIAQHDVNIDAILLIVTPQAMTDIPGVVDAVIQVKGKKPLLVSIIGGDHLERARQKLREQQIICNTFPNQSVEVLSLLGEIGQTKYLTESFHPSAKHIAKHTIHKTDKNAALPIFPPNLAQTFSLLNKYGFKLPEYRLITQHNLTSLKNLPYPLFAKTANLSLIHKAKLGAIYGKVENASEGQKAYDQLSQFSNEVLFQEMISLDQEILLGAQNDEQFGLYLTVGLGGSYTNLLADRQYVFLPASDKQLERAWQKTKAYESLAGEKNAADQVFRTIQKLQKLLLENPWIKDLEINPLVVNEKGVWVTDIKIHV